MKTEKFEIEIGNKNLIVEMKNLAEQANGNCLVRYGDTVVLGTAVISKHEREGIDFFPLTVEYEERFYAAGKILGSRFMRREGRPSDEAILTGRGIDRVIRPRFLKKIKNDVQIVITCLSWDGENDPDIIGLIAASMALSNSDIPWSGPAASVRVGRIDSQFILNPTYEERKKSDLDLILAAVESSFAKDGKEEVLINMIEMEGKEIQEDSITQAYDFAKPYLKKLIDFQKEITKKVGKEKMVLKESTEDPELEKEVKEFLAKNLETAIYFKKEDAKKSRQRGINDLIDELKEKYPETEKIKYAMGILEKEVDRVIHENVLNSEKRADGRKIDEIREITGEVGFLPRTHGSSLFVRGETKAISILTLGSPSDVRLQEGMEISGKKRFMHHYNFPPYSSGETKPMRGPGRREIGHGMLAEKAIASLIPDSDEFPYTIRVVSEILSSNGSSSMAATTAASLALMDAGVPLKNPVTGIALGLMSDEKGNYKILTDIQGPEDHYGDMDFKVAGTKNGITAIQMDVKIKGITPKILKESLDRAKKARLHILEEIQKILDKPRAELSPFAPRIYTLQINPDKIREVIGPGGKVINAIIDECGVSIDIEDSGKIFITAEKKEAAEKALSWIKNITREVKVGELFDGKIKKIMNFGAFTEILPGQEGLIHISQLDNRRVEKVEDVVRIGDIVPVKVIGIDEQGKISLSLKDAKR